MDRPITTLFMLMSVDGKISTGSTDELDVDRDFLKIPEQTTDLWSFNTGRVQAKMGVNEKELPDKTPVSFVLLDNHHLTEHGVRYFCAKSKQAVVITSNPTHPAFHVDADNLHIIYQERLSLGDALTANGKNASSMDQQSILRSYILDSPMNGTRMTLRMRR